MCFFQGLVNGFFRLDITLVGYRAGVDDINVSFIGVIDNLVFVTFELSRERVGFKLVKPAAEGFESDAFFHRGAGW
jgi:hypothetical protein